MQEVASPHSSSTMLTESNVTESLRRTLCVSVCKYVHTYTYIYTYTYTCVPGTVAGHPYTQLPYTYMGI